jgi:formylglycine-generating enzyme required for sulfatase activity
MVTNPPRVFLSYAQEGEAHSAWVRTLAKRLREEGIDAVIDQYVQWPEQGWRPWMTEQIEQADWVLVVCTEEYLNRFDGNAPAGSGRGVRWESQHITQALYDAKFRNRQFIPVLTPGGSESHIPLPLKDYRNFHLDADYDSLYRLLTNQPATPAPDLGPLRRLPPLSIPMPGKATTPELHPIPNPYPGLAAFKPEDHDCFFGREADTDQVIKRLAHSRLVSVVGRSGTGKSSLVAAGVVPALRDQHGVLTYLRFKPQTNPFQQLAEALDRALPEGRAVLSQTPRRESIRQALESDPAQAIAAYLGKIAKPILLLADQFEELFTQTSPETAQRFRNVIDPLLAQDSVYLALTLRSEFMDPLLEWLGSERFAASLLPLDPIEDEARLRAIITGPAERNGVPVQAELLSVLVREAGMTKGALPLIALTLQQLFQQRDPELGLTLAAYGRMGGLKRVVETAAADIDADIRAEPELEQACERLFAHLATVIDELPTRRTTEVEPLRSDAHIGALIEALRAQGFLADPDDKHIELAHETLLSHWPRLRDWCARHVDQLALVRQAEQAAREWQQAGARERAAGQTTPGRHSELLRWTWERQQPALEALLTLRQVQPRTDPDFTDPGLHAWRTLEGKLEEPLCGFLYPEPLRLLEELKSDATPHHRREEIGLRLNQMGDPRRGVGLDDSGLPDIVWSDIPAGRVTLENRNRDGFDVAPFRIARYPITWRQYRTFIEADDGYRDARWWEGLRKEDHPGEERWGFANYPAVNVSWYDAVAFCRWLSDRLGLVGTEVIRLPAEWEWQWVAQGGDAASEYPWGEWNPSRANSHESGIGRTTAVGMYPGGSTPEWALLDLTGNVWEWCLNAFEAPADTGFEADVSRVLRGGAWDVSPWVCRAANRGDSTPDGRGNVIGFRVCRGAPIEPPGAAPLVTGSRKR